MQNILFLYLEWHFFDVPKELLKAWRNFLLFNLNYFSVGLLLSTLFSPWRRYKQSYGRGFDLKRYLETFTFNLISRAIGAVMRIFLITVGLVMEILIFFLGLALLISWFVWPIVLVGGGFLVIKWLFGPAFKNYLSLFPQFFSLFILLASSLIVFGVILVIFVLLVRSFINKLKNPKLKINITQALAFPQQYDLTQFLVYEARRVLKKTIKQALKLKKISSLQKKELKAPLDDEMASNLLFYFLLLDNPKLNFVFTRLLLDIKKLKKQLWQEIENYSLKKSGSNFPQSGKFYRSKTVEFMPSSLQQIVLEALRIAQQKANPRATVGDLLLSLARNNSFFKQELVRANLKEEDVANLVAWQERLEKKRAEQKKFWQPEFLSRFGSLGKEWAAGYTITLDQYSYDLTASLRRILPEIIGHKEELEAVERILSQRERNKVLLVGEIGTGRRSIVHALAVKSILGRSSPQINYKRIVQLNLTSLLAKSESPEATEATLEIIFQEVIKAGNVILFIDDFDHFVGSVKERPGTVDISAILSRYLTLPQFQLIAITTFKGLHTNIEQVPGVLSFLQKVEVKEISLQETLLFLQQISLALERVYKKMISYPALRELIALCDKYIADSPFPKKAVEVLDEVVAYVAKDRKRTIVLPSDVAKVIQEKTKIPVGELEIKEKEVLLNLESLIHQRIINQEEAVKEISEALRRARAGIATRKGPMGSFLFLGPTGCGKTETAKALSEIYFGSEKRIIRLDMSEFQAIGDIPRLLGRPGEEGLLTTQVREKPFSLILFDELEKAHPNILNLFMQVLDEGWITDGENRKVDFKNSIIIATSNAGFQIIIEAIKQKIKWSALKEKLLDYLFERAIFRPEFINRFDAIVIFQPLTKQHLLDIVQLMLNKLAKNLKEKHIDLIITESLKEKLVELGYSPTFGARQLRRVLQDRVENPLARALLAGNLKRGDKVKIDEKTFNLQINR